MSATISLHGHPYTYEARYHPPGTVTDHPAAYSRFTIKDESGSNVDLYFGRDGLDALIYAAANARAQWDDPEPAAAHECGPGRCTCGARVSASGEVTPAGAP